MAKMEWTKEQQKVIDLKDRNILVSAAAGSGKTAVLVERIIQKVITKENPIDIDRLLIVTFTKAAASEMKERIGKALEKKLMENPDNLHLQKQMTLIHSAHITTIHSFCKNLIGNYFSVINLDPGMRLVDEVELKLLKSDVAGVLLEKYYDEGKDEFYHFIEAFSTGKTDEGLENLILQLYDFSVSYPWPKEWLEQQKRSLEIENLDDLKKSSWMKFMMNYICKVAAGLPEQCRYARRLCLESGGPEPYLAAIESDLELVEELAKQTDYEGFANLLAGLSWEKLKRVKKDEVDAELQEEVKAVRKHVKDIVDGLRKKFFFQPAQDMLEDIQGTKKDLCVLLDLAKDFYDMFQAEKLEKKVMDFNDLEHYALNILIKGHNGDKMEYSDVADELSEFYEEIMIDEYQDSNSVQELLLNSISKERFGRPNVFMVGDVKQSIYKFRLARPELFMEKFESYLPFQNGDSKYQRIDLKKNFRSRGVVLDFTNFIFKQIMQKQLGNIEYDEDAYLYEGASFEESDENISDNVEVLLVNGSTELEPEDTGETEEQTARELEARAVAAKIRNLMGMDGKGERLLVYDGDEKVYRGVEFRDIVILLRTVSGWSEDFISVLAELGIPAVSDTQSGYFSAIEVKTVLNLLQIIDNPKQDIPLAAVLYSPMFGFVSEELAKIRADAQDVDLYDSVIRYSTDGEEDVLQKKAQNFLEKISLYRSMMPYTSIRKIIEFILEDTGYYEYASVMPAGEQRAANLDMLVKKAQDFESTSYKGLFQFNRYIEKLHKYDIDFGEAFISKDGINAVRIMSIHKSKGLEFPVVFVSGLGKQFNMQDSRSRLIVQEELGLGSDFIDISMRIKKVTLQKRAIQSKIKLENLGEELRVLYVALTRAKEKLILTGYDKKLEQKQMSWMKESDREHIQMSYLNLSEASSYLDFIGPCLYYPNCLPIQITVLEWTDFVIHETNRQAESLNQKEQLLVWNSTYEFNPEIKKLIRNRLESKYAFENEQEIPVKFTVSELKRRQRDLEEEHQSRNLLIEEAEKAEKRVMPVPRFMTGETAETPVQKGILYHKVMQKINFNCVKGAEDIERELERMVEEQIILEKEKEDISRKKLNQFFQTDMAKRMAKAEREHCLYRERQFVIGIPAKELPVGVSSEEMVLIQGVVDAYMECEKEVVLIDYKTDYVARNGEEKFVEQYKMQIKYYNKALEQITGKPVTEKYLYSFYLGKWYKIE